ncbi:hypothetical protein TraAM80_07872 [Trypanosoma rangeli]|uniref:Uncharacterized protein n=1 Tax=Trypanosoma rangeli TaxID=5698 RepID=A0A422N3E7_TRYRA|nr:uncharacterized protein TraAM80_07872 [Trypanosoma rangeli]RNF00007.1 hypothetical protein TraAM80_07872 [Trypanosoma rangeli]|eukprot:RNF00007.1 hypothetical protein TraAM80_07872 [Trypanosoma rangeli]
MIGAVHRVFPERGYGFVLAVPPPTSLALMMWLLLTLTTTETESEEAADAGQQQKLLSQGEHLSVWFPLRKYGVSTLKRREKCERAAHYSLQLSPGSYVKFSATCHYGTVNQRLVWRAGCVCVQCDAEELREALQKVKDLRWDCIILDEVKRKELQIARQYALVEQMTVESAFFKRAVTAAETFRALLLEEAVADDIGTEELQMRLAQERVRGLFDCLSKAAQRHVVREADLRRPLLSMWKDVGT